MQRLSKRILPAFAALFFASASQAVTITTASLGGDKVCTTLACATQTHAFGSSSAAGSGGTISLSGTTLTFSINAGSASLTSISADPSLSLAALVISGSATVVPVGGGAYVITGGAGSVSGTANSLAFSSGTSAVGGTCATIGGNLTCGITFAYLSSVGLPGSRAVLGTVNLQTPEPSLSMLLGAALIGGLAIRRRRS
jgi:hypothetical protein